MADPDASNEAVFYRAILDSLIEGVYFVDRDRRISYWNRGAAMLTGFSSDEVVGRLCHDELMVHTDERGCSLCHTSCPAVDVLEGGAEREEIVYLRHKNGHRVPVRAKVTPMRDSQGTIVGAIEMFTEATSMLQTREQLAALTTAALIDPLTGLANRRQAQTLLHERLATFARHASPFAVLFADVDHFKHINDTHGHAVGDKVLQMVAKTLANGVRPSDGVARWGGEEFLVILANFPPDKIGEQADKLRRLVESSCLPTDGGPVSVSISIGAVSVPPLVSYDDLLHHVDRLMYDAKDRGRNRVCVAAAV